MRTKLIPASGGTVTVGKYTSYDSLPWPYFAPVDRSAPLPKNAIAIAMMIAKRICPPIKCNRPTSELTRRRDQSTLRRTKLVEKHAPAARVQRFVMRADAACGLVTEAGWNR